MPLYRNERGPTSGLPVVFIHGFPFSHAMWLPQLEAASASFRAIAYDLRGFGASRADLSYFSIEGHVDDLVGLLDELRVPQAILVGLSMGGYIALRALERNPERILGAVLADTRAEADSNEMKIKRAGQMKQILQEGLAGFAENQCRAVFTTENLEKKSEIVRGIRDVILQTPLATVAGHLSALAARTDTTAALPKIQVPTLILVGEKDTLTPPEAARAMHENIPGSRLEILPHAAHLSNLENPEAFNRHLLQFLRSFPIPESGPGRSERR